MRVIILRCFQFMLSIGKLAHLTNVVKLVKDNDTSADVTMLDGVLDGAFL